MAERARSALTYARQYVQEQQLGGSLDSTGRGMSMWGSWARDLASNSHTFDAKEEVSLIPGWAARVPRAGSCIDGVRPFDIHLCVSGYAALSRSLADATPGQRAVISLAKRYAAISRPTDIPPLASNESGDPPAATTRFSQVLEPTIPVDEQGRSRSDPPEPTDGTFALPERAKIANHNLNLRLSPFWAKPLALRPIRISVEPPSEAEISPAHSEMSTHDRERGADPLLIVGSSTDAQGHFSHRLIIPWERLRGHPSWSHSLRMYQSDHRKWRLKVSVRLEVEQWAVSVPPRATNEERPLLDPISDDRSRLGVQSQVPHQSEARPSGSSQARPSPVVHKKGAVQAAEACLEMAVNMDGGIRIISDLDDTVKHSDILAGGRETFRNVFCRPLSEICVPGASELFRAAKNAGVNGFHFVSNSPFELLPSIREFLAEHRFPKDYSLKLKYYGGRSLLTAFFESPADRKRPAIISILDSFPSARFILFGDSGEQDLELYVSIALERPAQVASIYIRDISSGHHVQRQLPSGQKSPGANRTLAPLPFQGHSPVDANGVLMQDESVSSIGAEPLAQGSRSEETDLADEMQVLSVVQQKILRRAAAWRSRLDQARSIVPDSVDLVVFRDVQEITQHVVQHIVGGRDCIREQS